MRSNAHAALSGALAGTAAGFVTIEAGIVLAFVALFLSFVIYINGA